MSIRTSSSVGRFKGGWGRPEFWAVTGMVTTGAARLGNDAFLENDGAATVVGGSPRASLARLPRCRRLYQIPNGLTGEVSFDAEFERNRRRRMTQMLKQPAIRPTVAKTPPIIGPIFEDFRGSAGPAPVVVGDAPGATDVEVSESFCRFIAPIKALIALD